MNVRDVPTDSVRPYQGNPRVNDRAVDAVARSIADFGFRQPIVVGPDLVIVVGHVRWLAARKLGLETVPVHEALELTEAQRRAYRLADNRLAEIAEWNPDLLALELSALAEQGIDGRQLGFGEEEMQALRLDRLDLEPPSAADEVPELPAVAESRPGDLWILGQHRVLCGDSTRGGDVARLLAGARPALMVTDPPYGVEYDAAWRHDAGLSASGQTGRVQNDDRASWAAAFRHHRGPVAYVWHAARYGAAVERSLHVLGFEFRAQIIWVKRRFAISRGHYHWRHETCLYAARSGTSAAWSGGRKQSTVWADIVDAWQPGADLFAARVDEETLLAFSGEATTVWEVGHDPAAGGGHSTQKPVECMARPIRHHGAPGDGVFEPFCGSGTTVIACEQLERRCFAVELDPRYCDAIVQRWEKFTGRQAAREGSG